MSGAPFSVFVGFPKNSLAITEGKDLLQSFNSSVNMCRYRCGKCGSPVYGESLLPDFPFVDVPLGASERDDSGAIKSLDLLKPTAHINYDVHVAGMVDAHAKGIPKFTKMPGSEVHVDK